VWKTGWNGSAETPRPTMHFVREQASFDFVPGCKNSDAPPSAHKCVDGLAGGK
jgi:hypothetical protein